MDYNEKEAKRREEDRALNCALIWVGAAIVLEFLMVMVNKHYINLRTTEAAINLAVAIYNIMQVLRVAGLAALVVGVIWAAIQWKRNKAYQLPVILAIAGAAFFLCTQLTITFKESGVRMLLWLIPAWAALALAFYLYQREFFLSAVTSGLGMLGLWFVRHTPLFSIYTIVTVVCIVGMVILMIWLKLHGGYWLTRPEADPVVGPDAGYPLMFLSGIISLLVIGVASFLNLGLSYYLLYVMVAWLFALLVYYTVKMM